MNLHGAGAGIHGDAQGPPRTLERHLRPTSLRMSVFSPAESNIFLRHIGWPTPGVARRPRGASRQAHLRFAACRPPGGARLRRSRIGPAPSSERPGYPASLSFESPGRTQDHLCQYGCPEIEAQPAQTGYAGAAGRHGRDVSQPAALKTSQLLLIELEMGFRVDAREVTPLGYLVAQRSRLPQGLRPRLGRWSRGCGNRHRPCGSPCLWSPHCGSPAGRTAGRASRAHRAAGRSGTLHGRRPQNRWFLGRSPDRAAGRFPSLVEQGRIFDWLARRRSFCRRPSRLLTLGESALRLAADLVEQLAYRWRSTRLRRTLGTSRL